MSNLHHVLSYQPDGDASEQDLSDALECLDRFTAAFNSCNSARVDDELAFPHVMMSGAQLLIWNTPGQHPPDFFDALRASGWHRTRYDERVPVLASPSKIHYVVRYSRLSADDRVISSHTNVWVITRSQAGWKIAIRSY